jgi:hypothetical protein
MMDSRSPEFAQKIKETAAARLKRAKELIKESPDLKPSQIVDMIKKEFGVGLGNGLAKKVVNDFHGVETEVEVEVSNAARNACRREAREMLINNPSLEWTEAKKSLVEKFGCTVQSTVFERLRDEAATESTNETLSRAVERLITQMRAFNILNIKVNLEGPKPIVEVEKRQKETLKL